MHNTGDKQELLKVIGEKKLEWIFKNEKGQMYITFKMFGELAVYLK